MDESWRMSIEDGARRRSIANPDVPAGDVEDDDDFHDVFGGPPRILRHRRSAAAGFYKEVFSTPLAAAEAVGTGRRNLPGFCIPPAPNKRRSLGVETEDGFYDDIFGSSHFIYTADPARDPRSRSRSTTKSSSGNNCKSRLSNSSSDHDSSTSYLINSHLRANPHSSTIVHHQHHHDASRSSLASKLRPITIPTRQHNSSQPSTLSGGGGGGGGGEEEEEEEGSSNRTVPISNIQFSSFADNKAAAGSTTIDFFQQHLHRPDADFSYSTLSPSAETRSSYYCPNCCRKQMMTNSKYRFSGAGSPSSVASSAALEPILSTAPIELRELEKKVVVEVKKERERSFANQYHFVRETEGAAALDEAIAWARGKFWNQQASDITSDEIVEYSEEPKGSKEKPSLS